MFLLSDDRSGANTDFPLQAASQMLESGPEDANAGRLKAFGLQRLGAIVQARTLDEQNWASSRSELIAAKELLNRNNS